MKLRATERNEAVIPTASMADIAFLLIVFFMVTFTSEVDRTQVELPLTVLREEVPAKAAYVSITDTGLIRVSDGDQMSYSVPSADDVLSFAVQIVSADPTKKVVIKADTNVPFRDIDRVIDALKQADVRVIYFLSNQAAADGTG